jgi:hypothetical protein
MDRDGTGSAEEAAAVTLRSSSEPREAFSAATLSAAGARGACQSTAGSVSLICHLAPSSPGAHRTNTTPAQFALHHSVSAHRTNTTPAQFALHHSVLAHRTNTTPAQYALRHSASRKLGSAQQPLKRLREGQPQSAGKPLTQDNNTDSRMTGRCPREHLRARWHPQRTRCAPGRPCGLACAAHDQDTRPECWQCPAECWQCPMKVAQSARS